MMRLLVPVILAALAIGLFVLYTNPTYQNVKVLSAQAGSYDDALNKSQELRGVRDKLIAKRNTFSTENLRRLEYLLPDNVDNIRLIIDINNIAARRSLTLKNVELGKLSDRSVERSALAVGSSGDPIGSVELGFSVTAGYDNFIALLQDLQRSLRLVEIEKISVTPEGDLGDYKVTIRTYWLH